MHRALDAVSVEEALRQPREGVGADVLGRIGRVLDPIEGDLLAIDLGIHDATVLEFRCRGDARPSHIVPLLPLSAPVHAAGAVKAWDDSACSGGVGTGSAPRTSANQRMFRRSGYRFAAKNMRQSMNPGPRAREKRAKGIFRRPQERLRWRLRPARGGLRAGWGVARATPTRRSLRTGAAAPL